MGTRNLTCVVLNGEMKVAQYGQWDGYLSGQGKTVIDFIAKKMNLKRFKQAVSECRWATAKEIRQSYLDCGDSPTNTSGRINMEIGDLHAQRYPSLNRDTCSKILQVIQDGTFTKSVRTNKGKYVTKTFKGSPARLLTDEHAFASDSLFCEWAYVLDLDTQTLEIYKGFNQETPKGRFAKLKVKRGEKYKPITLWQTVSFAQCKKSGTLAWLMEIDKRENEEEEEKSAAAELKSKKAQALLDNALKA